MKKFKVIAQSISFPYVIIEANTEEEAFNMASEVDGGDFIDDNKESYWEILEVKEIKGE